MSEREKDEVERVYSVEVSARRVGDRGWKNVPALYSAVVIKRSEKQVRINYGNDGYGFGWHMLHRPDAACLAPTPEEAWSRYVGRQREALVKARAALREAAQEAADAEKDRDAWLRAQVQEPTPNA